MMGSLCTLPLSSIESVLHFILGTLGSSVCLDCFAWVALVNSPLCPHTWPVEFVGGMSFAVSGVGVMSVQILFKVVEHMVKVCGHLIFGKHDISHYLCLCSAKYDWSCHVGYFKYGWKCFVTNMQI